MAPGGRCIRRRPRSARAAPGRGYRAYRRRVPGNSRRRMSRSRRSRRPAPAATPHRPAGRRESPRRPGSVSASSSSMAIWNSRISAASPPVVCDQRGEPALCAMPIAASQRGLLIGGGRLASVARGSAVEVEQRPLGVAGRGARCLSSLSGSGMVCALVEIALAQARPARRPPRRRRRPWPGYAASVPFGALAAITLTMLLASNHGPSGGERHLDLAPQTSWRAW